MAELLLELLSEEIPARMQRGAVEDLRTLIGRALKSVSLTFHSIDSYVTPHRLVVVVNDLVDIQADWREERRGPRVDAPKKAIEGFLKSVGLEREQLEERETDKGRFLFAVVERKGRSTAELLAEVLPRAVASLPWPKSMRWGAGEGRWVRPLHRILCLFDGAVVPFGFGGLKASDATEGHRFMAPEAFAVKDFADYRDKLRAANVMLDPAERASVIEQDAKLAAEAEGLTVKPDPELVAENAGLVEWPVVLMGEIDPAYMDVPPEVLTTAMRHHLKHFALLDTDGNLAPRFLVVSNMKTKDKGKQIIAGNERVLRARLADAKFFWDQDRKRTLESRVGDLDGIVFHAKLGSLGEKVERLWNLAAEIAAFVPGADEDTVREAAPLCKADLTTEMVGEFPELQGVMGRYYALGEGKPKEVADAIAEHYSPLGPNDDCPSAPASVTIALADKIDTLAGFFAIDEKPTGSKDPFALRRAALGAIRLIIENKIRLPLKKLIVRAHELHAETQSSELEFRIDAADRGEIAGDEVGPLAVLKTGEEVSSNLLAFFADRLKVHLREKGVRPHLIAAVFALDGEDDLVRLLARVDALEKFLRSDDGEHLLTAYRRAANIVRIEEKRDGVRYDGAAVDRSLLREADETAVADRLAEVSGVAGTALAREDFATAMASLATLRAPVDTFFDNVTVNCDDADLRQNRLRLLSTIQATMNRVADFSKIEGGER